MSVGNLPDFRTTPPTLACSGARAGREASAEAAGVAPPRYIANNVTPPSPSADPDDLRRWRSERFTRRRTSGRLVIAADRLDAGATADQWVRPRRVARCSWRLGETVSIHHSPERGAHFSGTERCASIWGCPVCSAVIRADRARDVDAAVVPHLAGGGGALFVTGTLRHKIEDPLSLGLHAVMAGWSGLIRGAPWKKWKDRIGLIGFIRSIEVTYGENGWHPHMHGVLLLAKPISDRMVAAFTSWVSARWSKMVQDLGAREPSDEYGFTVKAVRDDGRVLSSYIAKPQEKETPGAKVGAELSRGDLKSARGGGLMPFELLDTPDDPLSVALWLEYLDATAGRRCIQWSTGLRDRFDLGEERTPEEVIADTDAAPLVATIAGDVYDRLRKSGRDFLLLDHVEQRAGGAAGVPDDLLDLLDAPPVPAGDETLPESGPKFPGLAGVLTGSRLVHDIHDRLADAVRAGAVPPMVVIPQFDWDRFERRQSLDLARVHARVLGRPAVVKGA